MSNVQLSAEQNGAQTVKAIDERKNEQYIVIRRTTQQGNHKSR